MKKNQDVMKKFQEKYDKDIKNFSEEYKNYLSECKTERIFVKKTKEVLISEGFIDIHEKSSLKEGDKVFVTNHDKNIFAFILGKNLLKEGLNLIAAHMDSPRLDLKPHPYYHENGLSLLQTHYYGGIKKYQWATIPLAIYGFVVRENGDRLEFQIGDKPNDPVFYISDLLPHLAKDQMGKKLSEGIDGESLNVLCGSIQETDSKDKDKKDSLLNHAFLSYMMENYQLSKEELIGAEIQIVPAFQAQDVGFDRSMIMGYGHDDRSCCFAAIKALLSEAEGKKSSSRGILLVDKEEIGSLGNTGMESQFLHYALLLLLKKTGQGTDFLSLQELFNKSKVLSGDVTSSFDSNYPSVEDKTNAAYLGQGISLNKYTGARGKSGASEASSEFTSALRNLFWKNDIPFQLTEMGKVDQGGGGTVAMFLARYNMEVIDAGVSVLSMHAPYEILSKSDLFSMYKAYTVFLSNS